MDEELDVKEIRDPGNLKNKEKKEKKKHKAWLIVLLIFLFVVLIGAGAVLFTFFHFFNKTNYVKDPEVISTNSEALESIETMDPSEVASLEEEAKKLMEESEQAAAESREEQNSESAGNSGGNGGSSGGNSGSGSSGNGWGSWSMETKATPTVAPWDGKTASNVLNLMCVGVDREQPNWNGNSDTMILISINFTRRTVTMTSFMRDSAAHIPGAGFTKLNHSFAIGGGPLLLQTIRNNYGIDVQNYAWVDFNAMREIFKILGGVDLYLTPEEAKYCGYGKIETAQVCHLNASQAVMHCRDRRSGGYDYQRTQRQRDTLMAIANKAKAGSLGDLVGVANAVLPYITHNVNPATVAMLLSRLPEIAGYTFNEQRIPYNGMFTSSGGNLIPVFQATSSRWHTFVYGY